MSFSTRTNLGWGGNGRAAGRRGPERSEATNVARARIRAEQLLSGQGVNGQNGRRTARGRSVMQSNCTNGESPRGVIGCVVEGGARAMIGRRRFVLRWGTCGDGRKAGTTMLFRGHCFALGMRWATASRAGIRDSKADRRR